MNKENEIKDICKLICATCAQFDGCAINCKAHRDTAEALYNEGYRKTFASDFASDTQKEYKEGYIKGIEETEAEKSNAVKEFAQKIKDGVADYLYKTNFDGRKDNVVDMFELCEIIDGTVKEY